MQATKRKDSSNAILKKGEIQRKNGLYQYSWTDSNKKRNFIYAKTLAELREKEKSVVKDALDGIKTEARYTTINDIYDLWINLKRGLKNNTFENYRYMYDTFARDTIGKKCIGNIKKSDVKRFYNNLVDNRGLQIATVDNLHTIMHQVFQLAVDDEYIRNNPSDNVMKELKQSHIYKISKRRGLTIQEQKLFLEFLKNTPQNKQWYPVFAVMTGTGLRVGEITGLRWCDVDFENNTIDVNHTLVYYAHRRDDGSKKGCYYNVQTPKSQAGIRLIPMLDFVKEALIMEKNKQEALNIKCEAVIDGYTDFIFLNRFGKPYNQGSLNRVINRIIRDCNDEQFLKSEEPEVLLPNFSCHSLRHTYTTRLCEAGVNIKVIQNVLGHTDITTTLNIYTDVTNEFKKQEFDGLDKYFR